ncbi:NAD(P)-binding protein [Trichodelitschia bisporula]|uniref:NAD(P)-binding protein n=1 Tax=Trichodelitschia bisporula TaxID=703511 RepID=A0A6G1IAB6_9PEZI|nr:NAD(P)-binding protein [Trichodelitschia bisporula]
MAEPKVLIVGASGYIGGSILAQLLQSTLPAVTKVSFSALVRSEPQAAKLTALGVDPILFKDLDDAETIIQAASQHDGVLSAAPGFHPGVAKSLITGLGRRKAETGGDVFYIHTTGTSDFSDTPISGDYTESRTFKDTDEDLYAYLRAREKHHPYLQRTTDITVVETGRETGVRTVAVMSPTIYGRGRGFAHTESIQLPDLVKHAVKVGAVEYIGDGEGTWDYVHIDDLVKLYELVLALAVEKDPRLPTGEKGFIFSATGSYTFKGLAEGLARAGFEASKLKEKEPRSVILKEGAEGWGGGNEFHTELNFVGNSRSEGVIARQLGWKPEKTEQDWEENFAQEFADLDSQVGP